MKPNVTPKLKKKTKKSRPVSLLTNPVPSNLSVLRDNVSDQMFDWLIDWLFDWLTNWLIDWSIDKLIDWRGSFENAVVCTRCERV